MNNSEAYKSLISQINSTGKERDDICTLIPEHLYDWERKDAERIIWEEYNKNNFSMIAYLPKLKNYNGIDALKNSPHLNRIPSDLSVRISKILYDETGDEIYLDIIKKNIDASPNTISYVSALSQCKSSKKQYDYLVNVYLENENAVNRNTAVMGLLYFKGIVKDINDINESNNTRELRKKFLADTLIERKEIMHLFEEGKL